MFTGVLNRTLLTQAFFHYLLESRFIAKASSEKGRFRSFLLASLKNFISTERRKLAAAKRGGGQTLISLDDQTAEDRYAQEPADTHTPETLFELSWARTLLAQALAGLEQEYAAAHKRDLFARLQPYLQSGPDGPSYKATAVALGKTEDAVKSSVQRLRQRYQRLLRGHIARTVHDGGEVEDELRHLRQILTG